MTSEVTSEVYSVHCLCPLGRINVVDLQQVRVHCVMLSTCGVPMPMFCDKFLHTFGMDARFSGLKMPLLCCMNSWAVKH